MKQRDIWNLSVLAPIAFAVLCFAAVGLLLALTSCTPRPGPVPHPGPGPGPAGTPCERAAARYVELRCGSMTAEKFAELCEGYGGLVGSSSFNPGCMERAPDCSALSDCRGGT